MGFRQEIKDKKTFDKLLVCSNIYRDKVINMEKIKQELKQAQQLVQDAHDAPDADRLTRAYYSCRIWGLDKMIDTVDLIRCIKRYLKQKHR